MKNTFCFYLIIILIINALNGCGKDISSIYKPCDSDLADKCDGKGNGAYCTFGLKWGGNNPFPNSGLEKPGPSEGDIELTYAFMDAGYIFSTHNQEKLTSLPFENNTSTCTKEKFRLAFEEWSSITKVNFKEAAINESADIKIIIADIEQSAIGYPNFHQKPCSDIKGQIIFKRNEYSCTNIYGLILHEIGHVLGLGHVNSLNVMHPNQSASYNKLQPGDIQGIQSIYGAR
jgi:hypothetical protein